jgi:hypothetical protein
VERRRSAAADLMVFPSGAEVLSEECGVGTPVLGSLAAVPSPE